MTSIVGGRETGEMCLYLGCKNKDIGKTWKFSLIEKKTNEEYYVGI